MPGFEISQQLLSHSGLSFILFHHFGVNNCVDDCDFLFVADDADSDVAPALVDVVASTFVELSEVVVGMLVVTALVDVLFAGTPLATAPAPALAMFDALLLFASEVSLLRGGVYEFARQFRQSSRVSWSIAKKSEEKLPNDNISVRTSQSDRQ